MNADREIRVAYNAIVETGAIYFWDRRPPQGVHPDELLTIYRRAFRFHRDGFELAAERWARTAKHLARALWHEAKIAYIEPRSSELPFLEQATADELDLHVHSDTTLDMLNSLEGHIPPGLDDVPEQMRRYLSRARKHLGMLDTEGYAHELLRAERIKAAYEYGRTVECMALAYEAEAGTREAA